ncbi:MAG TPA: STAS domain-containing protein [candidate division Zixibacteria bacterium]|nr:STAS domain-containing protein [candidate division Zixibacteria bacterium]
MFTIEKAPDGAIKLAGRFDAAQVSKAAEILDSVTASATVDFSGLDYISSGGLGSLVGTQQRLMESGHKLTLANLNGHIRDIFRISGLDQMFEIT